MEINISDERIVERLHKLADQLNQTPEQLIADAINQFSPTPHANEKAFWNAIRGIADSGDPTFAERDEEILAEDVDLIRGWGSTSGDADSNWY